MASLASAFISPVSNGESPLFVPRICYSGGVHVLSFCSFNNILFDRLLLCPSFPPDQELLTLFPPAVEIAKYAATVQNQNALTASSAPTQMPEPVRTTPLHEDAVRIVPPALAVSHH